MSVPTKTELRSLRLKFCEASKAEKKHYDTWCGVCSTCLITEQIINVLLEDHQKEVKRIKEEELSEYCELQHVKTKFKEMGWLSPSEAEELRGIIKGLQDVIQGKVLTTEEMEKCLFGVGGKTK